MITRSHVTPAHVEVVEAAMMASIMAVPSASLRLEEHALGTMIVVSNLREAQVEAARVALSPLGRVDFVGTRDEGTIDRLVYFNETLNWE